MKFCNFPLLQLITFLLLVPVVLFSQGKQGNNWYFGEFAGLTFNPGSPPEINTEGQINAGVNTGTACVSDGNGNLLLYSDGISIWNGNHQVIGNGSNMGIETMQGGLFVPWPGDTTRYFFFNFSANGNAFQFQYSVINVSSGTEGSVLPEQKCILLDTGTTGHLSGVHHSNGIDFWIVVHAMGSDIFKSYLVTNAGVSAIPVISAAGADYSNAGFLKLSPDGKWLASANPYSSGTSQLFRFNKMTGTVSNDFLLNLPADATGIEFSPDNKKLYLNDGSQSLLQFDLSVADPELILASQKIASTGLAGYGAMQLAPDGKILITSSHTKMGVLHHPCLEGVNSYFQSDFLDIAPNNCKMSIPNFVQSWFNVPSYITSQHCVGLPTQFVIESVEGIDSVHWHFSDPGNSTHDTSTLFNPQYTFSSPGTYYPALTVFSGFLVQTITDTVIIYPYPVPDLGNDTSFCPGNTFNLTLNAGDGEYFFWNNSINAGQPPFYQAIDTGTYTVKVVDHGCAGYDTIQIGNYPGAAMQYYTVVHDYCSLGNGAITITAQGEDTDDYWYSITGGLQFEQNQGYFTGLYAGVYNAIIKTENNCMSDCYPIIILNLLCSDSIIIIPDLINTPEPDGMVVIVPPGLGPYTVNVDGIIQTIFNDTITGLIQGSHTITITQFDLYSITFTVVIEGVLSIDEPAEVDDFTVFQSENGNSIIVDLQETIVPGILYAEVRNITGILILKQQINSARTQIYTGPLQAGLYIITMVREKGRKSVKFMCR